MLTRRSALLSTLAAGACASTGDTGEPADALFRNIETPSLSVHSGVASDDGQLRVTARHCWYPDLGLAWVWIHARTPEGFFSYVDHMAPSHVLAQAAGVMAYRDDAQVLEFVRTGEKGKPTEARITGACMARKSATSAFGKGDHRLEVSIRFSPERAYSGLLNGRTEVFGRSRASVIVDGKQTTFEGPAQFHEQDQTNPRFTAPFCYMSLWGHGAASTLLIAPRRRDGYLLEGNTSTEAETIIIDPPGPTRRLQVKLADGRTLEGEASVVQPYTLPLVGHTWRGHMVNVRLDGRDYRGQVNDYAIGDGIPYAG